MKRPALIVVCLFLSSYCSFATDYNALLQKGNSFYKQKIYDSAVACMEQIAATKPANAIVYFDLGNSYYRSNKIPQAILNYQRTLWLEPDNKEAKENLLLAQSRINNSINEAGEIFFIKWWHWLTRADRTLLWSVIAVITFVISIGLFSLRHYNKGKEGKYLIPLQLPLFLLLFWACSITFAYASALRDNNSGIAVVMYNDTPLMNPDLKGKAICMMPEGTTIHIKTIKGDWAEILVPDGRKGWVQLSMIEKV